MKGDVWRLLRHVGAAASSFMESGSIGLSILIPVVAIPFLKMFDRCYRWHEFRMIAIYGQDYFDSGCALRSCISRGFHCPALGLTYVMFHQKPHIPFSKSQFDKVQALQKTGRRSKL